MITTLNLARLTKEVEMMVTFTETLQLMKALVELGSLTSKESQMEFRAEVAKCQLTLLVDTKDMSKFMVLEKMCKRFKMKTRKKMMKLTKHSILGKMRTIFSKTLFLNNKEYIIQSKVHRAVLLEKEINKMIVKKAWAWEWAIDKGVVMMLRMKVEVQMSWLKTAVNILKSSKYLAKLIINNNKDIK